MNRHSRFYAELQDNLADDDYYDEDDYNYDEEDYYNEDEVQYRSDGALPSTGYPQGGNVSANPSSKAPVAKGKAEPAPDPTYTTLISTDHDYPLLLQMLPQLQSTWSEVVPPLLPFRESEAVEALRSTNYDVAESVQALRKTMETMKEKGGARVLKVTGTKKSAVTATVAGTPREMATPETCNENPTSEVDDRTCKNSTPHVANEKRAVKEVELDESKTDCTFVIAGHVDAGKSTTLGHLLLLLGQVSQAEVDKNDRDGKSSHKSSFKYAWLLDQSEEERRRGVTIDAGSYCFQTEHRRIHILDAPGHKDFVLSMISSATQADAALLVVTAAISEFETGLAHGTKEHLLVLKTLGVGRIVVAVNKMDSVAYSKDRYDFVVRELKLLLKQTRIKEETVAAYCPISGVDGLNLTVGNPLVMPWYTGPSLVELLDMCPLESRLSDGPVRMSLHDIQGSTLYGKVESGVLNSGSSLVFPPCDVKVVVKRLVKPTVGGVVAAARAGDTVEIHTNSSLVGLCPGCVGCETGALISVSTDFEAHVQTFPSLSRAILPGATFTMVVHALTIPVKVTHLISKMDARGNWSKGMTKCISPGAQALILFRADTKIALEPAVVCRALGRFVLQQDGETVAGGLVRRVVEQTHV